MERRKNQCDRFCVQCLYQRNSQNSYSIIKQYFRRTNSGIVTRQATGELGYDQASIYIRGFGTWTNRSPLILVDGIERDMNTINTEEVESISVLKDASATAVYGVRGANGVILITTKRGQLGKPKVTLRSEYAVLTGLRYPEYINAAEYAGLMNEARDNAGVANMAYTDEEIELFRNGSSPYLYPNVNWWTKFLRRIQHRAYKFKYYRWYRSSTLFCKCGLYNAERLSR